MGTFMKALLISGSIAGLANLAAIAGEVKTGVQTTDCPPEKASLVEVKPLDAEAALAVQQKKADVNKADGSTSSKK
ncbi:MAG: hypothetical protein A2X94_16745 [Bdellovibrionales bacterium GWB1_55_8]|nr:MAG: hypothetical protein A2X94_16745 [Bdellovibrionales bacterium GWB1_55_8]